MDIKKIQIIKENKILFGKGNSKKKTSSEKNIKETINKPEPFLSPNYWQKAYGINIEPDLNKKFLEKISKAFDEISLSSDEERKIFAVWKRIKLNQFLSSDGNKIEASLKNLGDEFKKFVQFEKEIKSSNEIKEAQFESYSDYISTLMTLDYDNLAEYKKIAKNGHYFSDGLLIATSSMHTEDNKFNSKIYKALKRLKDDYNIAKPVELIRSMIGSKKSEEIAEIKQIFNFFYSSKKKPKKTRFSELKSFAINMLNLTKKDENYGTDDDFIFLMNCLRDSSNKFDIKNIDFLLKILGFSQDNLNTKNLSMQNLSSIIESVKNNDGEIDKFKASRTMRILEASKDYSITSNIMAYLAKYDENQSKILLSPYLNDDINPRNYLLNFVPYSGYLFDEDLQTDDEKLAFVAQLSNKANALDIHFMNFMKEHSELNDYILDLISLNPNLNGIELHNAYEDLSDYFGAFNQEAQKLISDFLDNSGDLRQFNDFFNFCLEKNDDNSEINFDKEKFDKLIEFLKTQPKHLKILNYIEPKELYEVINGNIDISKLDFNQKTTILYALRRIVANEKYSDAISQAIDRIKISLDNNDYIVPVDKKDINDFIKEVLISKDNKYTAFEQKIVDSIPLLEQMEGGLPLKYPRKKFVNDLYNLIKKYNIEDVENKIGIKFVFDQDNITPIGYDGMIKLDKLNQDNEVEKEILSLLTRFLYSNEIKTEDDVLNEQLNTIIKAFPEFINIIGKKQHDTHKYSLDIHSLLVFSYSIQNENYLSKLDMNDKALIKLSTLFHDITKKENIIDTGHQNIASIYAKKILSKIVKSSEMANRIFMLIDNHHWLKEYSDGEDKDYITKQLAINFRYKNDFEIAKIMADSDIKAVNDEFYEALVSKLDSDKLQPIDEYRKKLYATAFPFYTNFIVQKSKSSQFVSEFDNEQYNVINLRALPSDEDMEKYGFGKGVTKKDLRFLVHMIDNTEINDDINKMMYLSMPENMGVISETLISLNHSATYLGRKNGLLLSQNVLNFINADKIDQHSGKKKNAQNAVDLIFDSETSFIRKNYRDSFLNNLGLKPQDVSDSEYVEFFKEAFLDKKALNCFDENQKYQLAKKTFTGMDIANAIKKTQESLIDKTHKHYNEIIGFMPKVEAVISKEDSLDKLPKPMLDFAKKYNLPIILI